MAIFLLILLTWKLIQFCVTSITTAAHILHPPHSAGSERAKKTTKRGCVKHARGQLNHKLVVMKEPA
jgi:hypothetical protein